MKNLKRKSYWSIFTLLLLSSCTSEPTILERCIEVNFERLNFVSKEDRKIQEQQDIEFCNDNIVIREDGLKMVRYNAHDDIEANDYFDTYKDCPRYLGAMTKVNREFDAEKVAERICNEQGLY